MVRIRRSHRRGPGSIPGQGSFSSSSLQLAPFLTPVRPSPAMGGLTTPTSPFTFLAFCPTASPRQPAGIFASGHLATSPPILTPVLPCPALHGGGITPTSPLLPFAQKHCRQTLLLRTTSTYLHPHSQPNSLQPHRSSLPAHSPPFSLIPTHAHHLFLYTPNPQGLSS